MNAHSSDRFRRENHPHGYRREMHVTNDYDDSESYDEEDDDQNLSDDSDGNQDVYKSFSSMSETHSPQPYKRYIENSRRKNDSFELTKTRSAGYVTSKKQPERKTSTNGQKEIMLRIVLILVIFACVYQFCFGGSKSESVSSKSRESREGLSKILEESMGKVRRNFQNQKIHIWNDILARMYDVILYPEKPSIIILFSNETTTMNCLAQLLGELSGVIVGSDDYLLLTPQDFSSDTGEVVYNLKILVSEKRAVVVQDLLNVNTQAIKAFHNLCDRENPLVNRTIYIITMVADGYEPWQQELEFVEKTLNDRLSREINEDILYPLVTRITDGATISIQPELTINRCSFHIH